MDIGFSTLPRHQVADVVGQLRWRQVVYLKVKVLAHAQVGAAIGINVLGLLPL